MKDLTKLLVLLFLAVALSSCAHSPCRSVKDPTIPFERPGYSVLTPAGGDWKYCIDNQQGRFKLNFFKRIPDPKFHSLAVGVIETPNSAVFKDPQEFEQWTSRTVEMAMNPNRLRLIEKKMGLDNKFGPYTLKYYTKSEDHRAVNRGNEPFLILVDYGYIFVHPNNRNLIVQASYSERGRSQEIRPDVEQAAELFFNGIRIEKTP